MSGIKVRDAFVTFIWLSLCIGENAIGLKGTVAWSIMCTDSPLAVIVGFCTCLWLHVWSWPLCCPGPKLLIATPLPWDILFPGCSHFTKVHGARPFGITFWCKKILTLALVSHPYEFYIDCSCCHLQTGWSPVLSAGDTISANSRKIMGVIHSSSKKMR